jgi:quinoprotein glucose dehydrogenase
MLQFRKPWHRSMSAIATAMVPFVWLLVLLAQGQGQQPYQPEVRPASNEPELALKGFRLPAGMKAEVFAAEPHLANPIAFCLDEKGRLFVAETFRVSKGVTDNRQHMYWLEEDLACRTVEDRVAMYRKWAKGDFARTYELAPDRIRLGVDTTGDGKVDTAFVFSDGYNRAQDGLGSGVLARNGVVYYTNIPDLWMLKEDKATGKAGEKVSLGSGFGVHVAFIGHDMHGLRIGPDGRLYWSIGDRGLNVKTREGKQLFYPDTGAVLRCELDGSNMEVYAYGLRNPQELAFDEYGNLFTGDNNCDAGDAARWVYVVEGGDSGWRVGYQYDPPALGRGKRGPWLSEKMWELPHPTQPASIVPPVAHIGAGPSGLTSYPGVGLPPRYKDHFFLADFRGQPGGSGIWSFGVRPKGAAFEVYDLHQFVWDTLVTDCDFGPDCRFYWSDWVSGWGLTGKGRVYRLKNIPPDQQQLAEQTRKLLAEWFTRKHSTDELLQLLEFPHYQVRQEAQFELAAKGVTVLEPLSALIKSGKSLTAKLHAVWALGQIARKQDPVAASPPLLQATADADSRVRGQAVKMLYEASGALSDAVGQAAEKLLADPDAQVRFHAIRLAGRYLQQDQPPGQGQGTATTRKAVAAALERLARTAGTDPYLRHACVMAYANRSTNPAALLASDAAPARLVATLALRRLHSPDLVKTLNDPDPAIVLEAARAIHDEVIDEAMPALAGLIGKSNLPEPLLVRVLNAHFRLGKAENAQALAAFAARADAPEKWRVEALEMLAAWATPGRRDRVTGATMNLGKRDPGPAAEAVRTRLGGLFAGSGKVREAATRVTARFGIKEVGPVLAQLVGDEKQEATVRAEAILALEALRDARLDRAITQALASADPLVRNAARAVLVKRDPAAVVRQVSQVLADGPTVEKQAAFALLGQAKHPEAEKILTEWTARLVSKTVPAELQLDVLEAARLRAKQAPALKAKLDEYERLRTAKGDELAGWREALVGGNAERGRQIFLNKSEVACQRCHMVGQVGGIVGPNLSGIGSKQTREYLLESIVLPNKVIAKGYETLVVSLTNGKTVSGIVKTRDAKTVELITPEGAILSVPTAQIDEEIPGKSSMPEDIVKHLSLREMRDLVEYLASLRDPPSEMK